MCAYYKTESANVKSRWACYFPLDKLEEMYNNNVKVIPNNQADCEVISKYIYRLLVERESWLLSLVCLPGVSLLLCGSYSRCHGFVCSL